MEKSLQSDRSQWKDPSNQIVPNGKVPPIKSFSTDRYFQSDRSKCQGSSNQIVLNGQILPIRPFLTERSHRKYYAEPS